MDWRGGDNNSYLAHNHLLRPHNRLGRPGPAKARRAPSKVVEAIRGRDSLVGPVKEIFFDRFNQVAGGFVWLACRLTGWLAGAGGRQATMACCCAHRDECHSSVWLWCEPR